MENQHYHTADPMLYGRLKEFVKELRNKRPTEAETLLWQMLRNNLQGSHFRRQHIIGCFIADFCCLKSWLVIEIDGGYHQLPEQLVQDEERTAWLETQGFEVLRFTNEEVIFQASHVLDIIKSKINKEK